MVCTDVVHDDDVVNSTTLALIVFIIILSLLVMLLLLLLLVLFYWQRLHGSIYHHHHHHSPLTKSSASSPLAPPRYVADSQLSSVVDCSDLDLHSATWVHGALQTIDAKDELNEQDDDADDGSCSGDSVEKPPLLLDARSNTSTPTVSCEQLSALDCDMVDDDDVTSSTRHNDVIAAGLCNTVYRYSW